MTMLVAPLSARLLDATLGDPLALSATVTAAPERLKLFTIVC